MDDNSFVNVPLLQYSTLVAKATKLNAILNYIRACEYSPSKNVIFAIAEEPYEGDD